ncbi:MAG: SIMPL domain-containing protein [Burkholderiaceae bacterium]
MTSAFSPRAARSLLVAALFVVLGPFGQARAEPVTPAIDVTGKGAVALAPDMALLDLRIEREAPTARAAVSEANQAMAAVIAQLRAAGVAERDLQTNGFALEPRIDYTDDAGRPRAPRTVGYLARQGLTVRVRELARVGELLDQSISLGVNRGGSVRFINDDPSDALRRARAAAMTDARERAQTMIEALGLRLGEVLSIREVDEPLMPTPMAASRMLEATDAGAVPMMAGENRYEVRVEVRWAISQ